MDILNLLIYLGKRGALDRPVTFTTSRMGSDLGISQQSVSRWLITLEDGGLVSRKEGIRSYMVRITPKGKRMMEDRRRELSMILAESGRIEIHGKVSTGLQDGKYYIGLNEYSESIRSKLGFKPFPGTLNIKLNDIDDTECKEKLCAMEGIVIGGFRRGERIFGSIRCFGCRVNGIEGAIVIPERSHYGFDVMEIISPFNLREKLHLADGSDVKVEVMVE